MDEIVYQCPECNFNADNLEELDNHMDDFHAQLHTSHINNTDCYGDNDEDIVHNEDLDQNKIDYCDQVDDENYNDNNDQYYGENEDDDMKNDDDAYDNNSNNSYHAANQNGITKLPETQHNLRQKQALNYNHLNSTSTADIPNESLLPKCISTPLINQAVSSSLPMNAHTTPKTKKNENIYSKSSAIKNEHIPGQPVINSDNHYERQYTCKRCGFFTNNPRAVLYHRKEFHFEKINVHECIYCQYASQYSGKVERHTLLRHKIDTNNTPKNKIVNRVKASDTSFQYPLNLTVSGTSELDSSLSNKSMNLTTVKKETLNLSQQNSPLVITKYQCNKCPCKYKRSNDLSKHLKMKHSVVAQRLSDYLTYLPIKGIWNKMDENNDLNDYSMNNSTDQGRIGNEPENFSQLEDKSVSSVSYTRPTLSAIAPKTEPEVPKSHNKVEGSYECPYCTYFSNGNDAEYLLHVKDHLSGKSFRCVLCNSVYKYRGDCVVHLKRKHQKADMIAQNYVERFNLDSVNISQVYELLKPKQTEETENDEKLFGCAYCDYKANYKGDVFKHQTRRHPGVVKNVTSLAEQNMSMMNNSDIDFKQHGMSNRANNSYSKLSLSAANNSLNTNRNQMEDSMYDNNEEYYYNNSHLNKESTTYSDIQNGGGSDHYIDEDDTQNDLLDDNEYNQVDETMYDEDYNIINTDQADDPNHEEQEPFTEFSDDYETLEQQQQQQQLKCKHCSYQINDPGKLLLHMATHYSSKPYMCPLCSHKATLKIDIQKHLHIAHSDYTSEAIYLNNTDKSAIPSSTNILASVLLNGNKDQKRPSSSLSSLSSSSFNSNHIKQDHYQKIMPAPNSRTKRIDYNKLNSGDPEVTHSYLANLKFLARRRSQHALRDKKFKCPLCARTSKWQWDIRKHMRTVHRGQEGGEVIVLKDKDLIKKYAEDPMNHAETGPDEEFKGNDGLDMNIYNAQQKMASQQNVMAGGSDPTGNKKFKCTSCPYRSNWKADLFRHLRKRHYVHLPDLDNVIILDSGFAAQSLAEYERDHGVHIRKRSRTELESQVETINEVMMSQSKRTKSFDDTIDNSLLDPSKQDSNVNPRLPVSIAELNIKPYKCLRCGFRSDRKSDTLRHIRVKHSLSMHPVKFLRIMSIKEASDSIEQYENLRLYKKIKNFNTVNNSDGASVETMDMNIDENADSEKPTNSEYSDDQYPTHSPNSDFNLNHEEDFTKTKADFYRCPFCSFKNLNKHVMRRHLVIHFSGSQSVRVTNPVYRCSLCSFRSKWQFFVKKHITMHHLSVRNAYVLRYPGKSSKKAHLDTDNAQVISPHMSEEILTETSLSEAVSPYEESPESDQIENTPHNEPNDPNKQIESITLTDYNGHSFQALFYVSCSNDANMNSSTVTTEPPLPLSPLSNKKKSFFCKTCPYTTKNYINLKQHLLQHSYMPDAAKCRYCDFYAAQPRLLKPHEALHAEYEPTDSGNVAKRTANTQMVHV